MRLRRRALEICALSLVLSLGGLLLAPGEARAYLDPGSMSFVFQTLAAAVLGALIALKLQWRRIKGGLSRLFSSRKKEDRA